ncbi:dipeptidase [Acidobacteriia bacterium AH_259_A11_L15]|nr:dipeptidase [Acidobacteriia bacterium AH_259_A11_L15]
MQHVVDFIQANHDRYIEELREFCAIPSVSTKNEHKKDLERCAQWLADHLRKIGMENVEVIPTKGHPILYADWLHAPGQPTLLFYGHYDVQPPEPLELWESPPFELTLREGNLYARGVVDDKGQVFIHLKAIEAFLRDGGRLPVNIKMMIEGEEEVGSENIGTFIEEEKGRLECNALMVSDTSMLGRGLPSVCYGLRGLCYFEVEVEGPKQDLHSGSFGGGVPNPINILCEMMAKLHDKHGRVAIPGFYNGVRALSKKERQQLRRLPFSEKGFQQTTGARKLVGEKGYTTVERIWARPTLDINGIFGGYTGEGAKTVIGSKATAKFSTRLVPNQDPAKITKLVRRHIERLAPPSVKVTFKVHSEGKPWVAPFDHPIVQAGRRALEKGFEKPAVFIREGGSIPLVTTMYEEFGRPCVLLGFGLPDENAHAPNEHMNLENYLKGILSIAYFYHEASQASGKGVEAS